MIHCNQVCMYNFPDDGCLKPKTAICPLSNIARDTNVLTNADHIRSMTDEELAKRIMHLNFCPPNIDEYKECGKDANCHQCWVEWLKQPYKEDT